MPVTESRELRRKWFWLRIGSRSANPRGKIRLLQGAEA